MRITINQLAGLFCLLLCVAMFGCKKDKNDMSTDNKPDIVFWGLSSSNQLIQYNAKNTAVALNTVNITGLTGGERMVAIDFRPATGQLYGISNSSRIYIINMMTGAANALGTAAFTPALNGSLTGFDFNPTVDRIRVVTSTGQNLRLHPETGTVAATDGNLNPGSPVVGAVAYTNSVAGATATTLFDIDLSKGMLYRQEPPNNGTLIEVGSLGMAPGTDADAGFDISPDNSVALATFTSGTKSTLVTIDLTTGKSSVIGMLDASIIGLAIPTQPVAYAVDNSNNLIIFNFMTSATPVSKAITGLMAAEMIYGIDMRPATGQLYALGSSSRLYTINMSSGVATAVGTSPFTTLLAGTSFGFDFNPTVDRIRVVSNTGQNLRLNPITGEVAAVDGILNPGTPAVSAAAYTSNFPGATTTVLFDIDHTTDKLYTQNPPNNGTLVEVGSLGVDVTAESGFDIGGISNKGYAILKTGTNNFLYSINLTSGAATQLRPFSATITGFAVGLGF